MYPMVLTGDTWVTGAALPLRLLRTAKDSAQSVRESSFRDSALRLNRRPHDSGSHLPSAIATE